MNKVLITGATGFIGSNLTKRLLDEMEVCIIVRTKSSLKVLNDCGKPFKVYIHDGTIKKMTEIFQLAKPDVVFHLAANFIAEHSSDDIENLVQSNISFGVQLLEAMSKANVKYLINTGTYWQNYNNESYNPVNLYAATKQAFEDLAKYYIQTTPMRMLTLKLLDTYGPKDPRQKLFSLFKRIADTGEELKMSPGYQRLGLVYIDDIIDAFFHAAGNIVNFPRHQMLTYTVAPKKFYSLREVADIFEKVSGKKLNISWGSKPYRAREMFEPYLGNTLPGWQANVDLYEGITRILE